MASSEQIVLSDFIKSVHQKLREDSEVMGVEKAWVEHCKDGEGLEKYATAMKTLAVNHWDNNYKSDSKGFSRVEWVYQFCKDYFSEEEFARHRRKETEIAHQIDLKMNTTLPPVTNKNLNLLDVGSCYNPFTKYPCFNVIAVDLAPASSDVHKCDFLNLEINHLNTANNSEFVASSEIRELAQESFHVVVFSLLLEYLPSPTQRVLCCEKAYRLLKSEGILIIITPDSKHVGANAKIMKTWRFILAKMGFTRIKYEKLTYLHCMVFRKSEKKEIAQRWSELQDKKQFFTEMVIPQDFHKTAVEILATPKIVCDCALFEELPHCMEME